MMKGGDFLWGVIYDRSKGYPIHNCYLNIWLHIRNDGTKETETYKYALWHLVKQGTPDGDLYEYLCGQE